MALAVDDLKVYYRTLQGDVRALDGISFGVGDGEIVGLAGESGCGKSTLGKSLVRLDGRMRYVAGHATLDGEELPVWNTNDMNRFRFKSISLVPQYAMSALNPTRRIGRMIEEVLESKGVSFEGLSPEIERRLELVGLSAEVLGMFPIELSGGMKQRTVLVLSTLLNPSLLVADEITSALDVSTQKAVARALVDFRRRGFVNSMLVITHDLAILHEISDSIVVMYAGRLAEKAPAETLVHSPRHPYTQLLISSLPMMGARFSERRLTGIPGRPPSLLDPPAGCRFRDRCPVAFAKCAEQPPVVEVDSGHQVACWKAA